MGTTPHSLLDLPMDDNTLHASGRKVLLMGPYLFLKIQCAFYSHGKQDFLQSMTGRASFTTAWSRQRLPLKLAVPSWLFLGCWGWDRKPRACWVSTIPGTTSLAPRLVFSRPQLSLGRCLTLIEQKKAVLFQVTTRLPALFLVSNLYFLLQTTKLHLELSIQ